MIAVSVALVLSTLLLRWGFALFLAPLNLSNENVVGAWFSGMLLLLASLHAADGFFRVRRTDFKAALAWCVICAMLLALSADEIGSLHERIDDVMQFGPWLSYLPFLIVLLGCCAWSFIQLWVTPSERSRVPGLILGFAILVSVGGQEYLEKAIKWPWYLSAFRTAAEEGSELLGMIVLIYTMLPNSSGLFHATRRSSAPAFSSVPALRWLIAAAAAAIAWPIAILSASLGLQVVEGHLSDWLASALFFLSAVLVLNNWIQSPQSGRFPRAGIVFLCMASALCVQIDPIGDSNVFPFSRSLQFFDIELNTRLLLLALCCVGAGESLRARGQGYRPGATLLAFVGILSALFAVFPTAEPLRWAYLATTLVALSTFAALSHALRDRTDLPVALAASR
ncbi:MAG: hypothetical protein WDO56_15485 [Gammaproteobacteria bacterium]